MHPNGQPQPPQDPRSSPWALPQGPYPPGPPQGPYPPGPPPPVPDGAQSSPSQQPDGAGYPPAQGFPQSGVPYPQPGPPAPPYPQSAPPVQHSVPPFTPPPQSGPPYAQPGPQFGPPGPQFPQQGPYFPPQPGPGAPRSGPNPVLIVLLGLVALLIVAPAGFFGIRYLTMEGGPYTARPVMCDAIDGDVFARLMAGAEGRNASGDAETPQCTWDRGTADPQLHLSMMAQFGTKHWLQGDSLADARENYDYIVSTGRIAADRLGTKTQVTGAGDAGECLAETRDRVNISYSCVIRDGNLVLTLDYAGAYLDPASAPQLDEAALKTALDGFWAQSGRALVDDYRDELR